jgi:parallel beta-helix repeat protein
LSKKPIAFMSYVRLDDQHEAGRLTAFCDRLSGEVRLQTGDEFHIFRDRNDIAWGQQWKKRIEDSLDTVTFLIPVITPGFFKSPNCREELERFVEREKSQGRSDLILPVYYVECSTLSDETKRESDPLAKIITTRQYADWRELRFEPFTSPDVCKRLAMIAKQIVEALERDQSTPIQSVSEKSTSLTDNLNSSNSTQMNQMKEDLTATASDITHGPAPKSIIPTLVVDALCRGHHTTITQALAAAKPGTKILVRPGLYKESIMIDKPVEIIGDGAPGEVVIEATGNNTVSFQANIGRIVNLSFRQTGGGKWFCIDIAQGRLDLEDCDITSQSLSCVAIHGGADPRLRRNRIHNSKQSGVFVFENGLGILEDNDIFANVLPGVSITTNGNPALRRNRIHDGEQSGVIVYENGLGILEDNDIFANALSGVCIKTNGNPALRRNRIHDGKKTGIYVYQNGMGVIEDNDIFANAASGVAISEGGNPTLRRNRIHDGKRSGIHVYEKGMGIIEDNDIFANDNAGVVIREGGNTTLRRNRILKNGYEAVWIYNGGAGVFEENDLRENNRGAWDIASDCEAKVKRSGNIE